MEKFNFWKIELKFWKKKNLKEKKLMIWSNIPEETVCFYMVLLKQMLNVQMILLLKHVQTSLVLMLSKKTLIGAIRRQQATTGHIEVCPLCDKEQGIFKQKKNLRVNNY